jgi:predicted O-methyltransferase YrrM
MSTSFEALQAYAEQHSSPSSALLEKIERETHLHVLKPRMLSSQLQGRFLSMISRMMAPSRILEIGTYTGYSALCLAEGLKSGGKLVTIDKNEELSERTKGYFAESAFHGQIEMIVGEAGKWVSTLKEDWDLVFIDADKSQYLHYYRTVLPRLRRGGLIIADNVWWYGKVADPEAKDKDTEVLRAFNDEVHNDPRVENVFVPIRDGLMLIHKK